MITDKFYKELGKLFYAVAIIDGEINPKEFQELKKLVVSELVPLDDKEDKFGTDSAYLTEFEFEIYQEMNIDSEKAYSSFITYFNKYEIDFTIEIKETILKIANSIASSFKGKNKLENDLLNRLKSDLNL